MGGGLMQLVAYGAQDIYLTGNPQITFFKVVYRRHTNFSMESIEQTWQGNLNATNAQGRVTATIARNGDLVNRLYVQVLNSSLSVTDCNIPSKWINTVECEIGGQTIDRQSGAWMEAWAELTEPDGSITNGKFKRMSAMGGAVGGGPANLFIPLRFWFCENPGLALPLIALQYHEVKIVLDCNIMTTSSKSGFPTNTLWADYIYLDTDERRRFAQVSHEYLITQIQYQDFAKSNAKTSTLTFNHPVKELIWTDTAQNGNSSATFPELPPISYQLKLNGHDRFAERSRNYFTRQQVWQYHTGPGGLTEESSPSDSIAVYSFALKPEEHQPSGTCNFSRIDNAQLLQITTSSTSPSALTVYAVNYNVLRIMSGMGGLAYSN